MKKKQIANLIMVAVMAVIAAAGILGVGFIKGWFLKNDGTAGLVSDVRGIVKLERGGILSPAEKNTVLRKGDRLLCGSGATVTVAAGDSSLILSNNGEMTVSQSAAEDFAAVIRSGDVFFYGKTPMRLSFAREEITFADAVALLCVEDTRQSVSVFSGSVGGAEAEQMIRWVDGNKEIGKLPMESLSEQTIARLKEINRSWVTCFTDDEPTQPETEPPTEPTEPSTEPALTYDGYCTITIRCDTILDNWEELEPEKVEFVPENGEILPVVRVGFSEGETVFEVLDRVCEQYAIQIEYSWTPMYDSYYIEGINQLYEFDCGFESGWMYKVNEWFPNYGCSSYKLKDGDVIVWCYTCKGLGADVGDDRMHTDQENGV